MSVPETLLGQHFCFTSLPQSQTDNQSKKVKQAEEFMHGEVRRKADFCVRPICEEVFLPSQSIAIQKPLNSQAYGSNAVTCDLWLSEKNSSSRFQWLKNGCSPSDTALPPFGRKQRNTWFME
jgi:hypothetical protein